MAKRRAFSLKNKLLVSSPIFLVILVIISFAKDVSPNNFTESKALLKEAWIQNGFTLDFYCNEPFVLKDNELMLSSFNIYSPRNATSKNGKANVRAYRIEFEHIMPAHNFGRHLPCWKNGGRKACKNDEVFNKMEADLYNIVPAIGEINADRSNYRYAEAPRNLVFNQYGSCPVFTDFKGRRFYPADYSKGLIARTYLYMSKTYNINLSDSEMKLMLAWDSMYPPNNYEIMRNKIIESIMLKQRFNSVWNAF